MLSSLLVSGTNVQELPLAAEQVLFQEALRKGKTYLVVPEPGGAGAL